MEWPPVRSNLLDPDRRRILRLAALGAATLSGGAYLLVDRLRGNDPGARVASTDRDTTTAPRRSTPTQTDAPASQPEVTNTEPPTTATTVEASEAVMLCREAWGAAPPTRSVPPHEITGLMVHHTAVVLDDNRKSPDRIRGHQRYHQSHDFADIAYHVFIDANGNVYEGRDPAVPGETFTDYDPTGWFLVVCEGNFDEQPLPQPQRDALARVLAWASARYGVTAEAIASHRQHAHTRCPGDAIHALVVDGTIARLTRDAGRVDLQEICGPEADERIAAIRSGTL